MPKRNSQAPFEEAFRELGLVREEAAIASPAPDSPGLPDGSPEPAATQSQPQGWNGLLASPAAPEPAHRRAASLTPSKRKLSTPSPSPCTSKKEPILWRPTPEVAVHGPLTLDTPALAEALRSEQVMKVHLSSATLVVVPPILIRHWQEQVNPASVPSPCLL